MVSHNLDGLLPLQVAAPGGESTDHGKELFLACGVAALVREEAAAAESAQNAAAASSRTSAASARFVLASAAATRMAGSGRSGEPARWGEPPVSML